VTRNDDEREYEMSASVETITFPVKDLDAAKQLFSALLGTQPYVDQPYYVGFRAGGPEIGLDPNGHASGLAGPVAYWKVADINARIEELTAAGASIAQDPRDVGGGRLIARLTDADGNMFGLLQDPA
jgi:predicted enzyme related to lactoylglutathione lyase